MSASKKNATVSVRQSATKKTNKTSEPALCRCCGSLTIFRQLDVTYWNGGQQELYSDMIKKAFGIQLYTKDGEPSERLICAPCVNKLREAYSFCMQVEATEQTFLKKLGMQPKSSLKNQPCDMSGLKATQDNSAEDSDATMPDGFDDELDSDQLEEYYSLGNGIESHYSDNEFSDDDYFATEPVSHTPQAKTKEIPSSGGKKKTTYDIIMDNQKSVSNATAIIKYSYACPFRNRFNHLMCYYCAEYYLDPSQLRQHTLVHPPQHFKPNKNRFTKIDTTRIDCKLCPEKITNLEDFKTHLTSVHKKKYSLESKDGVIPFKLELNVNTCTLCGEDFQQFKELARHMDQHFSNYMCETCGIGFMDEKSLVKHTPAHDGKRYPCHICGSSLKNEYTLQVHHTRLHGKNEASEELSDSEMPLKKKETDVPCQGCDQIFKSRKHLAIHVRKDHLNYRHTCQICGQKFFTRFALNNHMPTHTGERNFKCKECGKTYPRLKTLKEHMRIHTNDRRYRKPSPERDTCETISKSSTSAAPQPPQPLPSVATLEALEDVPFIVVPAEIEWKHEYEIHDVAATTEENKRTLRREIGLTDDKLEPTILDCHNSDSDDDDVDRSPLLAERLTQTIVEENLTTAEIDILNEEDVHNDRALQGLLPEDCFTFEWTTDKANFKSKRETFTGTPGPTFDMTDIKSPINIFEKMFDVEFIDRLTVETNRHAEQTLKRLKNKLGPKSRFRRWTPTDRTEIIAYMAIMILHGLYPLANEESYFSFNGYGTMPFFLKIMNYNRFLLLKTMLHFADNSDKTDDDKSIKLYKIQPVTDYFNDKFSSLYYPQREIAIDESLLKWHGRLSLAQKISKAARVGIKTYELCESSTGYLWQFRVYTGKSKTTEDNDDDLSEELVDPTELTVDCRTVQPSTSTDYVPTNATAKIVFDLMEPLLHRGHTLIMDKFYNCPLLARCLKLRQTDCYGTQRLNREFIPTSLRTVTKTDLRHGELVASYCRDLSLMVWRDANIVSMLSTYHSHQIGTLDKYNRTTHKPSVVLDYNKHMGGVVRKDQYLAAQPVDRKKGRVWYKKLFRRIFNEAIFNCYVIYVSKHARVSHRQFRTTLADELLKTYRHIDLTTERRLIYRQNKLGQSTLTTMTTTMTATTMTATTVTTTSMTATTVTTTTTAASTATAPAATTSTAIVPTATTSAATTAKTPCFLRKFTMHNRPVVEDDHFPMKGPSRRGRCWWCTQKKLDTRTAWQCIECRVNLCILGCFRAFHKP